MSATREGSGAVLKCDRCGIELRFPGPTSFELVRDAVAIVLLWFSDDARNRDLCGDCFLLYGNGGEEPLGILRTVK